MRWNNYGWREYVPVAKRRANAAREMDQLQKKGADIQPVTIAGRKIARSFWGQAWCEHLESFSDYENRLPRGRTYVRNGSVCHLAISKGKIEAKVCGSSLYTVLLDIQTLAPAKWKSLKTRCAGEVGSLLELLQGKLSDRVMAIVTDRTAGLFPSPREIRLSCSCPDWAKMCKHVAAVLYGVGARLDERPELLFLLRGVDHLELISTAAAKTVVAKGAGANNRTLDEASLGDVFGIDLAQSEPVEPPRARKPRATKMPATKKPATKKPAAKMPASKMPASKMPAAKMPAAKMPAAKMPAAKMPAAKMPASKMPAAKMPASKKPSTVVARAVVAPVIIVPAVVAVAPAAAKPRRAAKSKKAASPAPKAKRAVSAPVATNAPKAKRKTRSKAGS